MVTIEENDADARVARSFSVGRVGAGERRDDCLTERCRKSSSLISERVQRKHNFIHFIIFVTRAMFGKKTPTKTPNWIKLQLCFLSIKVRWFLILLLSHWQSRAELVFTSLSNVLNLDTKTATASSFRSGRSHCGSKKKRLYLHFLHPVFCVLPNCHVFMKANTLNGLRLRLCSLDRNNSRCAHC